MIVSSYSSNFDDIAYSELIIGNRFVYENQISDVGDITSSAAERLASELSRREPRCRMNNERKARVLVLSGGADGYLLNTLDSLASHASHYQLEVVLVPYYGLIENLTIFSTIPWLSIQDANAHGVEVLNRACLESDTENLVILSQYERVVIDTIDELFSTFDIKDGLGSVGTKILGVDGRLIEAGGRCYMDKGLVSMGKGEISTRTFYNYAHIVNFYSGCFATKKSILKEFGGFDKEFTVGTFEFLDYFHKLQSNGYTNFYQPLARTICYGEMLPNHGKNCISRPEFTVTLSKIKEKWPEFYCGHSSKNKFLGNNIKGHLLFLDFFIPDPESDAGSVTTVNLLKTYLDLGWHISFMPTIVRNYNERTAKKLIRMGVEVIHQGEMDNLETLAAVYPNAIDFVFAIRVTVLANLIEPIRHLFPNAPLAYFDCDLHYIRMLRESVLKNDWKLHADAMRTKLEELRCFIEADCSIVHTQVEYETVQAEVKLDNMVELPYVTEVRRSGVSYEKRFDVMFLGGYEHLPNVDAATYFVADIWNKICHRLPRNARLILVGSKPSAEIKALACDNIVVTGQVPHLEPYFDTTRVFVAPLRYGAGVKGKLITALAQGVPSVVTPIAAEGIPVQHGNEVLIADDSVSFGEEVVRLYNDPALWGHMQECGYTFIQRNASLDVYTEICEKVLAISRETWTKRFESRIREELM